MDDRLSILKGDLPVDIANTLGFSVESLTRLERWLLAEYSSVQSLMTDSEKNILDQLSRYVEEIFQKHLGGCWNIDIVNNKNAYYGIPVIERQGTWTECPVSLVTGAVDRRKRNDIVGILISYIDRHGDK